MEADVHHGTFVTGLVTTEGLQALTLESTKIQGHLAPALSSGERRLGEGEERMEKMTWLLVAAK